MDSWELAHAYRRAVAKGLVPAILCPEDANELVPVLDHDDEPAYKCLYCAVVYHIGIHVKELMNSNLKEIK